MKYNRQRQSIRCRDSMEIKTRTVYQESKIDTPFAL